MVSSRTATAAGLAVASLITVVGCGEVMSGEPQAEPAYQRIALSQEGATDAAADAGITFSKSSVDGDALILENVRAVRDGVTFAADILRAEGLSTEEGGGFAADRVALTNLTIVGDRSEDDADEGDGVTVSAGFDVAADTVTIDALRVLPNGDAPETDDPAEARRRMATRLRGLSFDALAASTVAVTSGADGRSTMSRLRLGGYRDGTIGPLTVLGIETTASGANPAAELLEENQAAAAYLDTPLGRMLTASPERTVIDRFRWEGADFSGVVADLADGKAPGLDTDDVVFGEAVVTGQVTYIGGEAAQRTARSELTDVRFEGAVPVNAAIKTKSTVTDLTAYAPDGDEDLVATLKKHRLDAIVGSGEASYALDVETGRMQVTSQATGKDLYGLRFSLALSGMDLADLLAPAEGGDGAEPLAGVALDEMRIAFEDERAVDVVFDLLALGSDQSAMTLRQQAIGFTTLGALQGGAVSSRVPQYANALSAFLSEGGTLTVSMTPKGGLSAKALSTFGAQDPAAILDTLDLRIEQAD